MQEAEQRPRSSDVESKRPLPYYSREQLPADSLAHFPPQLIDQPRWCMWRYEWRKPSKDKPGKWTKPPLKVDKYYASSTDKNTWTSFSDVITAYKRCHSLFDGIGCFISPPYVGLDLDHVRDPKTGIVEPWASSILKELDSYTELSPSGEGFHTWLRGDLKSGHHVGRVEIYNGGRFLTVTGGVR